MLSLYRAWLGPGPCVTRPAPPPGAHRPVPRRAKPQTPPPPESPPPPSPESTISSELDVERVEAPDPPRQISNAVLDIASCDGPVRFSRVLNVAYRDTSDRNWCRPRKTQKTTLHYYPCKTCGSKFPSYYFVHKHRKRCHADEPAETSPEPQPQPSTSKASV